MTKWEYLYISGALSQPQLNAHGIQGWELVTVSIEPGASNQGAFFAWVFKRPIQEAHK